MVSFAQLPFFKKNKAGNPQNKKKFLNELLFMKFPYFSDGYLPLDISHIFAKIKTLMSMVKTFDRIEKIIYNYAHGTLTLEK